MKQWISDFSKPADQEMDRFLPGILAPVRWVMIVALLLLCYIYPLRGWTGWPAWQLVLVFAGYNLLVELLRRHLPRLASFARVALLDLPVVGLIYAHSAAPSGPLFVLFLLIVTCAAASLNLRAGLLYTAIAIVMVAVLGPRLPFWASAPDQYRLLGVLVIILALAGVGTALLMHQLVAERRERRSSRAEAERLGELNRLRAEFTGLISHDLRTPLTAARAGLGMLEESITARLHPNERRLLGNIRRNIDRLGRLVDDLLTLNQIEAGAMQLDREPLDLRTVVADSMTAVQPLMREKGQILEVALPDRLPIEGDPRRLEQVLVNLLCNAHQHTPPGTRIRLSGKVTGNEVELAVADDGPGIPIEMQAMIFERFQRLDQAAGGSGLGLTISRSIVELHGGRIWVESLAAEGTTFRMALPLSHTTDEPATAPNSTSLSAQELDSAVGNR